jgi:catechol 2,3-dioxygenase-like lactoylglutathione lyase family enzyme
MIHYKEVAFTAYPSTNIARSRKFYEGVLELKPNKPVKRGVPFIEYNIGPGCIAIGKSPLWKPSKDGPVVALEVENFEEAVAKLKQRRIKFLVGPTDTALCQMVAMRDPDGNKISLHRRKPGVV